MINRNWLRRVTGLRPDRTSSKRRGRAKESARCLRVEVLEDRTLLSGGALLGDQPDGIELHLMLSQRMSTIDQDLSSVVGTQLAELHALYEEAGGRIEDVVLYPDLPVMLRGDRVAVEVVAAGDTSRAVEDLGRLGIEVSATWGVLVDGWLPVGAN